MLTKKQLKKNLLEAVRLVIETSCKVIQFPDYVTYTRNSKNQTIFKIKLLSRDVGKMTIHYILPEEKLGEILEKTATEYFFDPLLDDAAAEKSALYELGARVNIFLRSMPIDMMMDFEHLWDITSRLCDHLPGKGKSIETLSREEKTELVNEFSDLRRVDEKKLFERFLDIKSESTLSWETLQNIIGHFYTIFLPRWQFAKILFANIKQFENWEEEIANSIDIHLPFDLIKKLSSLDNYECQPSYLAAQHAAKICLMPVKGRYSIKNSRGFEKRIAKSKDWIEENPDNAAKLIRLLINKAQSVRQHSPLREAWTDPDNILPFKSEVPEIFSYIEEFVYFTGRKNRSDQFIHRLLEI